MSEQVLPSAAKPRSFKRLMWAVLPLILLADFENETLALRAVSQGAQDYLVKSKFEGRFLSRVIRYAIERKEAESRLTTQCAVTRALAEPATLSAAAERILAAVGEAYGWEAGAFWKPDARGGMGGAGTG